MGQRNDITNNIVIGHLKDDCEVLRTYIAQLNNVIRNAGSVNEIRDASERMLNSTYNQININYKKRVNALGVVDSKVFSDEEQ